MRATVMRATTAPWKLAAIAITVALTAPLLSTQPAQAQGRPACSDGPGNALRQLRDEAISTLMPDWVISHPFGPESPQDVWDRCIAPALPNNPPPPGYGQSLPDGGRPGRGGSSSGDPHIVTQDGVRYDFHGAGDFVLLESTTNDTTIQIRYRRFGGPDGVYSLFSGVAGSVDGSTFSLDGLKHGQDAAVELDGVSVETSGHGWVDLEGGTMIYSNNTFALSFDNGITIQAARGGLSLFTPDDIGGSFVGLHGNGDGDPSNDVVTRSGELINSADYDSLYGEFTDDWVVDDSDSLFATPFDDGLYGPRIPTEQRTLADFDEGTLADAAQTCADGGLEAGAGLDECVFDLVVTGDSIWATDVPTAAATPAIPAILASPLAANVPAIQIDAIGSTEGTFNTDWEPQRFIVAPATEDRVLRSLPPCRQYGAPMALIISADRSTNTEALTCDNTIVVPADTFDLIIANPSQAHTDFGFAISEIGRIELGMIGDETTVSGILDDEIRAVGELTFAPGTSVYVNNNDSDCQAHIQVLDATGVVVGPTGVTAACIDHGPIVLDGTAPFTLHVTANESAVFDLTVTEVATDAAGTAAAGSQVSLEIATPGQRASVELELEAGQRVYIETLESVDGDLQLLDPQGVEVASAFSFQDLGLVEATVTGTYTVIADPNGSAVGTQIVLIHSVSDDVVIEANAGAEVTVTLDTPGQRAAVEVALNEGERIYVETLEHVRGTLNASGPSGELATAFAFEDLGLITAESTGVYSIGIDGNDAAVGDQTLLLHSTAPDNIGAASIGDRVALSVETPGQTVGVTLDLDAGQAVEITNVDTINGRLRLIAPDGETVASTLSLLDLGEIEITQDGAHTLLLTGSGTTIGTQEIDIG